jgi:hypothetical protein
MSIPDYETLMLPLLRIAEAKKGDEVALIDAIEQLAAEFLTPAIENMKTKRHRKPCDA